MATAYSGVRIPDDLDNQVQEYIFDVIDWLKAEHKLESVDGMAVYTLAESYNTYIKAQEEIATRGMIVPGAHGGITTNPAVKIARDAKLDAIAIARDFGLTLASRGRIKEVAKTTEPSPLQQLLTQKG